MKLLKNKGYYIAAALLASAAFSACGSKDEPTPDPTPAPADGVEVTISTTSIQTKAAKLDFTSNDKMNVFAKTYNRLDAPNIVDGVVATFDGAKWTMSPKVTINQTQKNAFVYAVAPYDASYTDPQKIPVDLNRQVDLMYSGSYVPASLNTPQVKLTMKHALSLLSFNIVPVKYSGAGRLTSLKVEGDAFYTKGSMNAETGKITDLSGAGEAITANVDKTLSSSANADISGIWALPFSTKTSTVKFTAVIDGRTYTIEMPEVEVKDGWQYIFRLALTDSGLEFDPGKTETISLNVTQDNPQTFSGYGRIVFTANDSWLYSPHFNGDGVFGTITTPMTSYSYSTAIKVEGLNGGQSVSAETWNSTGFSIQTLDGISDINISDYE